MSTSTDAGTILAEAARLGTGTTIEERTADGAAAPVSGDAPANGAPPAGRAGAADAAPAERLPVAEGAPSRGGPAVDHATPPAANAPCADAPESWLRIERGHAEPEEIAAISVVLCAQLAALSALAEEGPPPEDPIPGRPHPPRRSACWSGCWTCG
ncbi:hypothetical protein [Streptomyces sp. NPDC058773]|uniref:hypothetical protein n=1 Tax=Streptomyces sp. NPDC058773 TaxID=3346632 RepID=UPI00369C73A4